MKTARKNFNHLMLLSILAGFLNASVVIAQSSSVPLPAVIEVVYFHAPNRCPSCVANETQTKLALEKLFKNEMSKGKVSFLSLDLKEAKNKALVSKYEIVFPTLLILKKQGGKEFKTDYTNTAFDYALNEPEKYEKLLQAEIHKQLNSK